MNNILKGKLTSRGNLNGNVNTIVFAHNYNDLTNKPKINNVTLQGNKTASELGLATPSDITVTSVNEQTGDVILSGSDIDYSVGMSLNAKIDDLESQIVGSGVQSVNGMTGNVTLTSNDINYSTGVTIKNKIDSVEGEIPSIYVSSVNGTSGAVTLTGSDIDYSEGVSLKDKIDSVEGEIPVIDYPVTSVNSKTGAVSITAQDVPMSGTDQTPTATAIGDLSELTTSVTSSLVGAVNEVNKSTAQDISYDGGTDSVYDVVEGVKGDVTALQTGKCNTLLIERKTTQVNMDNYYKSVTISLTKTGYTAIGIVGYQTNTIAVVCFRNNIEGTNAIVGLANRDGTTALGANVDLYIDVLYIKNT